MIACVELNTEKTRKRVDGDYIATKADYGLLQGAVHRMKECLREQRIRVPQLIRRHTAAHLDLIRDDSKVHIDGDIYSSKQSGSRSKEPPMLGKDYMILPHMHRRLQAATRKLGGILNQLEAV